MTVSDEIQSCAYDANPAIGTARWHEYGGALRSVRVCDYHARVARGSRLNVDLDGLRCAECGQMTYPENYECACPRRNR